MPDFDPRVCIFCGDILFEADERGPIITMPDGASYHFLCGLAALDERLGLTTPEMDPSLPDSEEE